MDKQGHGMNSCAGDLGYVPVDRSISHQQDMSGRLPQPDGLDEGAGWEEHVIPSWSRTGYDPVGKQ